MFNEMKTNFMPVFNLSE